MPETGSDPDEVELEQEKEAAAEAGSIGGSVGGYPSPNEDNADADPAQRPLAEAGEGESEGFELAERELEEHASHGDQHSAGRIIEDAAGFNEDARATDGGEADREIKEEPE
jgi:hypothetical protein